MDRHSAGTAGLTYPSVVYRKSVRKDETMELVTIFITRPEALKLMIVVVYLILT
jgi:hypothetical protein